MSIRNIGLCGLVALGAVVAHQPASASVVLMAGLADHYALPTDPTSPSPVLAADPRLRCGTSGVLPRKDFDDTAINRYVCTSFDLTPYLGHIKNAILEFNAKPGGGQSDNDAINLINNGGAFLYSASLAALSITDWLMADVGDTAFSINITNLLPGVTSLDFYIQDDTTVDFVKLTLDVPEPTSLFLVAAGLAGFGLAKKRGRPPGGKR